MSSVETTLAYVRNAGKTKNSRKPKHATKKNHLIHLQGNRCCYCGNNYEKFELCYITKNFTLQDGEIFENKFNRVVTCKICSRLKGTMDHEEFQQFLYVERKKLREEIVSNYPELASNIFGKYEHKCIYCEFEYGYTPEGKKLTIDHKHPLIRLGDNSEKNLASACQSHNKEKDSMTAIEFFRKLENQGRKSNIKKNEFATGKTKQKKSLTI